MFVFKVVCSHKNEIKMDEEQFRQFIIESNNFRSTKSFDVRKLGLSFKPTLIWLTKVWKHCQWNQNIEIQVMSHDPYAFSNVLKIIIFAYIKLT